MTKTGDIDSFSTFLSAVDPAARSAQIKQSQGDFVEPTARDKSDDDVDGRLLGYLKRAAHESVSCEELRIEADLGIVDFARALVRLEDEKLVVVIGSGAEQVVRLTPKGGDAAP